MCRVPEDPLLCVTGLILLILLHLLLYSDLTAREGGMPKHLKVKKTTTKKVCLYTTSIHLNLNLFVVFSSFISKNNWPVGQSCD